MDRISNAAATLIAVIVSLVAGLGSTAGADVFPEDIALYVRETTTDARHVRQLGHLAYEQGTPEERARLVEALNRAESLFRDATLAGSDSASTQAFPAIEAQVLPVIARLRTDIQEERDGPGTGSFVRSWAPHLLTRFSEDETPAEVVLLLFDGAAIEIDPLTEPLARHVWFTWEALREIWTRFAASATIEQLERTERRDRLWQSFNDIAYSLYPWEQAINNASLDFGNLDKLPGKLWIVAHPSIAVEMGAGRWSRARWDDVRVSQLFLLEFGVQFLTQSGQPGHERFGQSIGLSALLGFADDRPTGVGALLHLGTTYHIGMLYRDSSAGQFDHWTALVGLDLYGLVPGSRGKSSD